MYFQQNAWMEEEINMQWTNNTLIPGIGDDREEKVLFADNVSFQMSQKFHETCRDEINTTVHMVPENHTDKIQAVDAGCGRIMKVKIGEQWKDVWKRRIIQRNGMIDYQQRSGRY